MGWITMDWAATSKKFISWCELFQYLQKEKVLIGVRTF